MDGGKRRTGEDKRCCITIVLIISIFYAIIFSNYTYAALIHGTIYDVALDQQTDVKIEINTTPQQVFIAKNGTYLINLPIGNYSIEAHNREGYAKENVVVSDVQGDYVIDIILDPLISNPVIDLNDNVSLSLGDLPDKTVDNKISSRSTDTLLIIFILILFIALSIYILNIIILGNRAKKIEENKVQSISETIKKYDAYGDKVLSIIRKESRITQKDLRKQIPLSEGKISLIITDLEDSGSIRKIRKGRGNILVYIKD